MRRWLLVFLVLLLPLRGWVGEAMAGQMLQQRVAQAQQAAASLHGHATGRSLHAPPAVLARGDGVAQHAQHGHHAQHDHPAHDRHGQPPGPDDGGAHGDCGTCAACQVCSSVALSSSVPTVAAGGISHPRPQARQRRYTSAEALLAFKPPRG